MITVELNGRRVEVETEKDAKKALAKLVREERKEHAERTARYEKARVKAESLGYTLLKRVVTGQTAYPAWRFYKIGEKYTEGMCRQKSAFGSWEHELQVLHAPGGWVKIDHYGFDLLGVVCNGSGFVWCIVLQDRTSRRIDIMTVAVEGAEYSLVDCPGVTPDWFRPSRESEAAAAS